jgi:hypothetical protein
MDTYIHVVIWHLNRQVFFGSVISFEITLCLCENLRSRIQSSVPTSSLAPHMIEEGAIIHIWLCDKHGKCILGQIYQLGWWSLIWWTVESFINFLLRQAVYYSMHSSFWIIQSMYSNCCFYRPDFSSTVDTSHNPNWLWETLSHDHQR